jgi:hypothetical protein
MLQRVAKNPQFVELRKQLVEHPFGTIKRQMGQDYFLMCGQEKVRGEASLTLLAYNLKRVIKLLGADKLITALAKVNLNACQFSTQAFLPYIRSFAGTTK